MPNTAYWGDWRLTHLCVDPDKGTGHCHALQGNLVARLRAALPEVRQAIPWPSGRTHGHMPISSRRVLHGMLLIGMHHQCVTHLQVHA